MEADFSGYATKNNLKCSDGRTILPGAFKHHDKMTVPLVWQHNYDAPDNILGHAVLENRADGVYAYCFLNDTPSGQNAKQLVQHKDINALSIRANKLSQKGGNVYHGNIQEVSLVLSGANPGAFIDNINIQHGDTIETLEDEAVIYTGLEIDMLEHEDTQGETMAQAATDERTIKDVFDSMTEEQKNVVYYMLGEALESAGEEGGEGGEGGEAQQSDIDINSITDGIATDIIKHLKEDSEMTRNVFEGNGGAAAGDSSVLTHSQLETIVTTAQKIGSFKEALLQHAGEYGIDDINLLFPDAKALTTSPEFIARRTEWVSKVLGGTKHSPFAKVKTLLADITEPEARAKGYIKGNQKKEEVFKLLRRTTGPATIYKKQKLDRDDVLDITDIDVINFLKAEMRLMIEEEIARAILVGDGRSSLDEDKVKDPEGAIDGTGIRSILLDDPLYSVKVELAANVSPKDAVKGLVRARSKYRGTGKPTLFVSDAYLTDIMLEEDRFGRALYATEAALADKLRVKEIVTVDLFDDTASLFAIMVSLVDYTIGSNRGGELTNFEGFDIDFNQHKYLQETRLSGGLTKPFSAVVVTRGVGTLATPTQPSFDVETDTITIPVVTGVSYFNSATDDEMTGDVVITEVTEVEARADEGYYIAPNTTNSWTYTP